MQSCWDSRFTFGHRPLKYKGHGFWAKDMTFCPANWDNMVTSFDMVMGLTNHISDDTVNKWQGGIVLLPLPQKIYRFRFAQNVLKRRVDHRPKIGLQSLYLIKTRQDYCFLI